MKSLHYFVSLSNTNTPFPIKQDYSKGKFTDSKKIPRVMFSEELKDMLVDILFMRQQKFQFYMAPEIICKARYI